MDFCNLYDVDGKSNCLGVWGTAKKVGLLQSPRTTELTQLNFIFLDIMCCFDFAMSGERHYCAVAVINK